MHSSGDLGNRYLIPLPYLLRQADTLPGIESAQIPKTKHLFTYVSANASAFLFTQRDTTDISHLPVYGIVLICTACTEHTVCVVGFEYLLELSDGNIVQRKDYIVTYQPVVRKILNTAEDS